MKPTPVIDKQEEVTKPKPVKSFSGGGAVKLGDLIWVTIPGSSWWPAQVVDAHTVSDALKPRHRSVGEVLVRLYGSYTYLFVDPMKSRSDFRQVLNETKSTHRRIFRETLEMDRPNSSSSSSKRKRSTSNEVQVQANAPKNPNQNVLGDNSPTQTINGSSSKRKRSMSNEVQVQATAPKKPNQNVLGDKSPTQTINGSSSKMNTSPSAKKNDDLWKKLKPNAITPTSSVRRVKVMQSLGLAAPSGSPYLNGRVHPIGD